MITDRCASAIPLHRERCLESGPRGFSINQEIDFRNSSIILCQSGDLNAAVCYGSCTWRDYFHDWRRCVGPGRNQNVSGYALAQVLVAAARRGLKLDRADHEI